MNKKTKTNLILTTAIVTLLGGAAVTELFASTSSGQIIAVRENIGTTPARTSVLLAGNTACFANNGWYAFENANTGLGKNWTDLLVAARQSSRPITVVGTGTCDSSGVEKINFIDLK